MENERTSIFENNYKTVIQYDVKTSKKLLKPFSNKFLISPIFWAIFMNLSILMIVVAIGFYFGILGSFNSKRLYGDHCKFDHECEANSNLQCQNGKCYCTSSTFYNQTLLKCVSKQLNGIACSNENDCCCHQKCLHDSNINSKICSCTTDRWWDNTNSWCQKKSYHDEKCSTNDQCQLNTNLVCLSNKCQCSDPNINFWNGTYCDNVQSYMGVCRITPGCNPSQGLVCNKTEHYPFKCTCLPFNYWDSSANLCREQKIVDIDCSSNDQCRSDTGLYCDGSCKCLDNYFWSSDKCVRRMTYGEYCSGTLLCDTTTGLSCINSYCICTASKFWNSSFCISPISNGMNCDNFFSCNATLGLSCDKETKQCVCSPNDYWSHIHESCILKEINGTWCTHSLQCQTQNGLSCVTNRCFCAEFHYWSGEKCLLKQTVNTWCNDTYQCQDYNGLVCLDTGGKQACECEFPRYWNGNQCVDKLSFGFSCNLNAECNQYLGLACYGQCRCDAARYWTGSICANKKNYEENCIENYECKDNLDLLCLSGKCNCMPLMFWSGTKCEFKLSDGETCSLANLQCQNYAGLDCDGGSCSCNSTQYWVNNKCENYVGINQLCDETTYKCRPNLTCQGTTAGNFICQCGTGTYWDGTSCVPVKSYGETCDGWREPCDLSKKLKCLSNGEGSSCPAPLTETRCNCIEADFWNGLICVPKFLNHVITNVTCQCRQDLGLESRDYDSTYTCYNDTSPSKACACESSKFWGGEKCVDKKLEKNYCTENCQCREDLGLECQYFGVYTRYSCDVTYTGKKCHCKISIQYWNGIANGCQNKFGHRGICSTNCQCREDLGLSCLTHSNDCYLLYSNRQCVCPSNQYWTGSSCVIKKNSGLSCSNNCECDSHNCYTYDYLIDGIWYATQLCG